jgi:hypothetical protein
MKITAIKITASRVISFIGIALVVLICVIIYFRQKDLYSNTGEPNRVKSYGMGKFVSDVRVGWCNNEGEIIEGNPYTDSITLTVFLQNFDGWLLDQGRTEARILPSDFTQDELKNYTALVEAKKASRLAPEQQITLQSLQNKVNHWILGERSKLRLSIAGTVFESIPPFDATASPTYGTGEFTGETYNRVVFYLSAPKDPKELERWRAIIRAAGTTCEAQITVARPITGAADALRMPTLVNADAIYSFEASPVYRPLPLVPRLRQGAAAVAVILTITLVVATAVGTNVLRSAPPQALPAGQIASWSIARVVLAWWLSICVLSYAYLWALMGEYRNILSGSAPILLGIQGTTLILTTGFGRAPNAQPSKGFFNDLISESGEPEVSRLQMLVWNGILGIIFVWQSIFTWTMPEFDPTLMTLLGISSAAYVGFKMTKPK